MFRTSLAPLRILAPLVTAFAASLCLAAPSSAAGATYNVAPSGAATDCGTNSAANPFDTIQEAVACADGGDLVSLAPSGGTSYPGIGAVSDNVTIAAAPGAGARTVRVDLSPGPGPLTVAAGASVTVEGATLACEDGLASTGSCATPVTNRGALTLRAVAVVGSTDGPGIANLSPDGGSARLTVLASTVSDNQNAESGGAGGGIRSGIAPGTSTALFPSVTVANSTLADNGVNGNVNRGGGLAVESGSATVVNSTITGNQAGRGGGISAAAGAVVELSNTFVAGNIAGTSGDPDCSAVPPTGEVVDGPGGHNLIGVGTGCPDLVGGVNGDQVGVPDPGLEPLADNGGPTDTVALEASSPAIGAADLAVCRDAPVAGADQRGEERDGAHGCDVGAFDTAGSGGAVGATYNVAPSGAATDCGTNSAANPFDKIQEAVACADGGDLVSLAPSGGTSYPGIGAVSDNVTIAAAPGAGARTVRVDLSPGPGPLTVAAGASVTVEGATLACEDGLAQPEGVCATPVTNRGALTLREVAVVGSNDGPGIVNLSPNGGSARLTVLASTVSDNSNSSSGVPGGGIRSAMTPGSPSAALRPSVIVANSTLADNGVNGNVNRGGGLAVESGSATLINSTITGNQAGQGGGISAATGAAVELSNTLVAGNIAGTSGAPDCIAVPPSAEIVDGPGGHNLIGDGTGCPDLVGGANGDQVGVPDPGLEPLADNGGPTDTVALQASSPAIGAADLAACQDAPVAGVDQRGEARGTICEIGAFETSPVAADDSLTVDENAGFTSVPVLVNDTGDAISIDSVDTAATHGDVNIVSGPPGVEYRPDPGYCNTDASGAGSGPDDTFTYTLNGGSTATVSVTVTCAPEPPPTTPPGGNGGNGGGGGGGGGGDGAGDPPDSTPPDPDRAAPELEVTDQPKRRLKTKKATAKVAVSFSSEPGAEFTCKVDDGEFHSCSSPYEVRLRSARGRGRQHTVSIVATDAAGNASAPETISTRVVRKR